MTNSIVFKIFLLLYLAIRGLVIGQELGLYSQLLQCGIMTDTAKSPASYTLEISSNTSDLCKCHSIYLQLGGGVSMGGATQFPWKQKPCDHQYDHLVKAAKKKGGQGKRDEEADAERDHGYHVLEGPPGVDVDDYDYPAEQEGPEMVYHVLDGPTPVEEETRFIY